MSIGMNFTTTVVETGKSLAKVPVGSVEGFPGLFEKFILEQIGIDLASKLKEEVNRLREAPVLPSDFSLEGKMGFADVRWRASILCTPQGTRIDNLLVCFDPKALLQGRQAHMLATLSPSWSRSCAKTTTKTTL